MEYPVPSTQTNPPTNNNTTTTNTATVTASAAANPNSGQSSPNPGHPPYAEMIIGAIRSLNDRTGSSKVAIMSYLRRSYPNLTNKHFDMLTIQLKKMKNTGQLAMCKHSYKLPARSAAVPSSIDGPNVGDVSSVKKRLGGRPRKESSGRSIFANGDEEEPAQIVVPFAEEPAGSGSGPVLADQRRVSGTLAKPKSKTKRGPVPDEGQSNGGSHSLFVSLGLEDGPDMPKKLDENAAGYGIKRKRGRGRRAGVAVPDAVEAAVPVHFVQPQPQPPPSGGAGVDVGTPAAKKRRGRQPKVAEMVAEKEKAPKQSAPAAEENSEIAIAYATLERKFKFLQASVKETVSTVKPCVTNATAVAKLDQLDELASVLTP